MQWPLWSRSSFPRWQLWSPRRLCGHLVVNGGSQEKREIGQISCTRLLMEDSQMYKSTFHLTIVVKRSYIAVSSGRDRDKEVKSSERWN